MIEYRLLARRPSLVVGAVGPVLLVAWTGVAPREDDVLACLPPLLREARAARCGMIVAIHPGMPLPSDAVRKLIQEEVRKLDPLLVAGATVIERGGFGGAAARAVASTMQLVSRPSHPEKIVSSGVEAARFVTTELEKHGAATVAADTIARSYEAITREAWSRPDVG